MSFIQSTLKCEDCGKEINVFQGMQGMTFIGGHPKSCPDCNSEKLVQISSGWNAKEQKQ